MADNDKLEQRIAVLEAAIASIGSVGSRISDGRVTDPPPDEWIWPRPSPWPWPRVPRWPWPIPPVDPSPNEWWRRGGDLGGIGGVIGPQVDPSPVDMSKLGEAQIEAWRDAISLERKRLDAVEGLLDERLKSLKG